MYTDYDFYENKYYGDILTLENSNKWLSRASDLIDHYTFNRLHKNFPTDKLHKIKVLKCVCAVADALYKIDEQNSAMAAIVEEDGTVHGAISSISSGRESISYATGASSSASAYAKAASSKAEEAAFIEDIICEYIANIPDSTGVNLLYAGV